MTEVHPKWSERLGAIVALASLVGAAAVLVVATVADLGAMLVMLAGLLVVILGSWHMLTRRGSLRLAAVGLALAGLALMVGGLVYADLSGGWTAAVLILMLLSVGTSRYAFRVNERGRIALHEQAVAASTRHPVLIMNLKSGGGKAERFHLVDECRKRGIEPIVLGVDDDLLFLAEDAVARGADILGMAGGDGSQALVASVAARHGLPYVVVPAGTRNHFALDLGLDRDAVVGALDAFADGVERPVDLATVNGRIFVNNATLGLYAKIVQSPEYRNAKRQTAAAMLPDLLGPDAPGLDLHFTGPDGTERTTSDVIMVSNNPYELHRFSGRGTRKRLDRGLLGIASASIDDAAAAAKFVMLELAGKAGRFPGWLEWTAAQFQVDAGEIIEIGVDGEALQMEPPLIFEILPGVLRVRIPPNASGRSPAARAIHLASRSAVVDLIHIASGTSSIDP
jgi:diacylglycerol kinase family enzyme